MSLMRIRHRPLTVDEYNRMGELGILAPDERVELIEGVILPLSPQNKPHSDCISWATTLLVGRFADTHLVRVQLPLAIGPYNEPEPDFALVTREALARAERHPTSADLVIEVAATSLEYDRVEKASLYARAGIPDYWVINLQDRTLEVLRGPGVDPTAPFGFGYAKKTVLHEDEHVTPCALPPVPLKVADLLGPVRESGA